MPVARGGDHEGHADLTHALVGNADHGRLGNVGMSEEDVLDLGRIGVEAADDEHVLAAADDLEIARRVDEADVTRAEPARRGEGLGRGLGVIEIPGHDAAAAEHHFARLAGWDLAPVSP